MLRTLRTYLSPSSTESPTTTAPVTLETSEFVSLSLLSHAGGKIKSRQRMQKLVFLLDQELPDGTTVYSYKKYDYGPYASELNRDLQSLHDKGFINIEVTYTFGGSKRYTYHLLSDGEAAFSEVLAESDAFQTVHEHTATVFDEYGDLPVSNLIMEVRDSHYEEYFANSVYETL